MKAKALCLGFFVCAEQILEDFFAAGLTRQAPLKAFPQSLVGAALAAGGNHVAKQFLAGQALLEAP